MEVGSKGEREVDARLSAASSSIGAGHVFCLLQRTFACLGPTRDWRSLFRHSSLASARCVFQYKLAHDIYNFISFPVAKRGVGRGRGKGENK
jgi:hypothetical protein